MFIVSLEEKTSTFICFYFHNCKMLKCCDQNHNDTNQLSYDFMRNAQTSGEEPQYGIQLFRNLTKDP